MKKALFRANHVLLVALLMIAFSCKKEASVKKPLTSAALTDSNFVSINAATLAAKQAATSDIVGNALKTKVNGIMLASEKKILDYTIYPDSTNPSLYIFNYEGGGFIVMPADKRVEPILAYSNTGHFAVSANMPVGLSNWLSTNHKKMQALRKSTQLTTPKLVLKLWSQIAPAVKNNNGLSINNVPPPTCQPGSTQYIVGPLLQTDWAQGVPYNQDSRIPTGTYYYGGGRDPVGCVATAMGQVMYYWKYPTNYNWTAMPLTSDNYTSAGLTAVSGLMYDIGRSVGMVYGNDGSAPANSDPHVTANGFKSSLFHYSSATEASWNSTSSYETVQNNINAHQPVILSGATSTEGHEWVCDGYEETTFIYCPPDPIAGVTYLMFHMNWGWDETYSGSSGANGYYSFNTWSVYNGSTLENFSYQMNMTYNIHP